MTTDTQVAGPNADQLVAVYIKMRDAKDKIKHEMEERIKQIEVEMDTVRDALLRICDATGQSGGKTEHGTFTRTVKTRYWTTDWHSMHQFILEHSALDLLEQRLHQTNLKSFLQEHPELLPPGLNADSKYDITVRRASK